MTLPVDLLQRRPSPERYDAVVVGAGIAGLTCAAVLARGGARTLLVEAGKRAGGQLQTVSHQGYAVDVGPLFWDAAGLAEVFAAVGTSEVELGALHARDAVRLVVAREGGSTFEPLRIPVPGGTTSPSTLDAVRSLYGVPPRVFASVGELYQDLLQASPEQLEGWRATTLDAWLAERAPEPVVAAAMRRSALLLGAQAPERASPAMLAQHARWLASPRAPGIMTAGDGPVAGTRGIVQGLVDACIDAGVELRLGTRATGMGIVRNRFGKLQVRREEHAFADEVLAEHCVLALPRAAFAGVLTSEVRHALDASFPPVAGFGAVGVAWALRGVPEMRGAGSPEEAPLVRLVPPADASGGTFTAPVTLYWPSLRAPRVTPPGHALLIAQAALPDGATSDAFEVGRVLALLRTYVREVFPALPELLDWERHWIHPLGPPDPFVAPALPSAAPGVKGLWLAGAEVATTGALTTGVAAAALSGKEAADRILGR
ncbi:MAG: FAD-dependent oxidoreductase [Thermodesulfobacteriota bacterium]